MSFDDAAHASDLASAPANGRRVEVPTRRAPGRPASADEGTAAQRSVGDILRENDCRIFDTEDERMSNVVNLMVPADTRFGIRVRIGAGTYKIPFNGMPPLDIGTSLADIIDRWGPGRYIFELVRLGANDGTTGAPLKSISHTLSARGDGDVGNEPWPIDLNDARVSAEIRRDYKERENIRNQPGWQPYTDADNDDGNPDGYSFGRDGRGMDPRDDQGGHGGWSQGGQGGWNQGAMGGASGMQPGYGPAMDGSNPYAAGMPGAPGVQPAPGMIATDPGAYPPGTTWEMGPRGLIPRIPVVAPPPPALTPEAIAAAIVAAQPKREPSILETLLATMMGAAAAALQNDPVGVLKNVREAISPPPAPPPPPPPPPPAPPQGPSQTEIALQMEKMAAEARAAQEKIALENRLALEKIQHENEVRHRELEARQASQRAQDQIAALQNQLNAMRGQETEQSKALKAQIADLTKQVSAAQRGAATDQSTLGAFMSIASSPMGEAIGSVISKIGEKLTSDATPQQQPVVVYQQPMMPTGVPAAPQMQAQWQPEMQHAQAAPQWGPGVVPMQAAPQWGPTPDPVQPPMVAPVEQHIPMPRAPEPVQIHLPNIDPSMPPVPAEMPVFSADQPAPVEGPESGEANASDADDDTTPPDEETSQ